MWAPDEAKIGWFVVIESLHCNLQSLTHKKDNALIMRKQFQAQYALDLKSGYDANRATSKKHQQNMQGIGGKQIDAYKQDLR